MEPSLYFAILHPAPPFRWASEVMALAVAFALDVLQFDLLITPGEVF